MTAPGSPENRPTLFARMFGATRYVMTVAVLAVFLDATVLLIDGIIAAISLFLYQESRHHRGESTPEDASEEPSSKREEEQ